MSAASAAQPEPMRFVTLRFLAGYVAGFHDERRARVRLT